MLNSFSCKVNFISVSFSVQRFRVKAWGLDVKRIRFETMVISQRGTQDRSYALNEPSKEKEKYFNPMPSRQFQKKKKRLIT